VGVVVGGLQAESLGREDCVCVRILEDKGVTHVFTGKMKKESIKGSLLKEEGNRVLRISAARMA
jgi:hypothetical protein